MTRPFSANRLWDVVVRPVRKGFQPDTTSALDTAARWWRTSAAGVVEEIAYDDLAAGLTRACRDGIAFVLPTTSSRSAEEIAGYARGLIEQLRAASERRPAMPLVLIVGVQWLADVDEDEAVSRVTTVLAPWAARAAPVHVIGVALRGPYKVRTLRAAIALTLDADLCGLGWVDDDVRLGEACLARLIDDFVARPAPCVVGATKIPHERTEAASRWLFRVKEVMQPATNYPHGCCMLVDRSLLQRGIPPRYRCDDGYFCFEVLRRTPRTSEHLVLVPGATCDYLVGADRGRFVGKLKRVLLNHVVFLADYPPAVGLRYLREMLYPGFWPLARWDGRGGVRVAAARWVLQAIHLSCLVATAMGLGIRGVLGRPLREIRF